MLTGHGTDMNIDNINIYDTAATLNQAVATRWATIAADAIAAGGAFHVALAGGSTPKQLYSLLASREIAATLPWQQTHIYFGDERCVAPDHVDSNFNMARQALLDHVPIPAQQIHRIHGEDPEPATAALAYHNSLQQNLPHDKHGYHFDLVLLGLGNDGHIASLFPDTAILTQMTQLAAAVYVDKFSSWRISVTYPVLEQAHHVLLVVVGTGKADIVSQILSADSGTARYPVQRIADRSEWHLDHAAAVLVESELLSLLRHDYDQDSGC